METIMISGFPVDPQMGLRKYLTHQDIVYEVSNHGRGKKTTYDDDDGGTWCYYVTINERALSKTDFEEFWLPATMCTRSSGIEEPSYAYYNARFADADWHGGVTFYEKLGGIDGGQRRVKIGCDYAHLWDEGCHYDFSTVQSEAIQTIEKLRGMYEFYKRDPWNGMWLPASEMIDVDGVLYSPQSIESRKKSAERAQS